MNALLKLRAMKWHTSFDILAGEEGAWKKTAQASDKILAPIMARNKKWREASRRGMVPFG